MADLGRLVDDLSALTVIEAALADNVRAFVGAIVRGKPSGVRGTYIKKVSVSSTMGPGVRVELSGLGDEPRA